MNQPILSKKKANAVSNGVFLVGIAILIFTDAWWPGIILVLWATIASRQYLSGRWYYAIITTFVLGGLFFISIYRPAFNILVPIVLLIAGLFLIFRELYYSKDTNGEEKSEEIKEDADIDE